jgi:hypothetical protein
MLRGVVVLASAVGGLAEAKLGVPYCLPVRRIERYDVDVDPARPVPVIPSQDVAPWREALHRLLTDPGHRAELSTRSRAAALAFVDGIDEGAVESYLYQLAAVHNGGESPEGVGQRHG